MKTQCKLNWEAPASALARFNPEVRARKKDEKEISIDMYSTIGEYGDGMGVTAKLVSSILRKADGADVVVNINSPGGDFFEGLAIHSLLKEYKGDVTVKVLGMAASAASVIAIAGDNIKIAENAFFMIHNSWSLAMGNRNDMRKAADTLEQFDKSMVSLYASATGIEEKKIAKMMDEETWIMGGEAVDFGFAKALLQEDDLFIEEDDNVMHNASLRKLDVALAKAGMPRSERRKLLKDLKDTQDAVPTTPSAGPELSNALSGLLKTVTT